MALLRENRQIHLIHRPVGLPLVDHFKLRVASVPELREEEILVRSLYLSVDPFMRGRIGGRPSSHPPFPLDQPASGDGIGRVEQSKHPDFLPGEIVCGHLSWADYTTLVATDLRKLDAESLPITAALSVFGMPALTGYFGLVDLGQPRAGETIVISSAAGAVGTTVGQIAKMLGCRVIGITGSDEKVNYLLRELRFDAAINYKRPDWVQGLEQGCPSGVDLYFDNVGGIIADEVIKQINCHARIILCGQIASYNLEQPEIGLRPFRQLIVKSALAQGFLVYDYQHRFPEARQQLKEWLIQGKIKVCETTTLGLENIVSAFLGLFSGDNLGKQLVQVEVGP